MLRAFLTILLTVLALTPTMGMAQSGDATWLNNLDGLETAVGRAWMVPTVMGDESSPSATPAGENSPYKTYMLTALVYQFDSSDNAATGAEMIDAQVKTQSERDPRSPIKEEFDPNIEGTVGYGHEGTFEAPIAPGKTMDMAIVDIVVQSDTRVIQVFGQFVVGDHRSTAVDVATTMVETEPGTGEMVYDMAGGSEGGLWDVFAEINLTMPEGTLVNDLEIFPTDQHAVRGNSVVPGVDLDDLGSTPGLINGWSKTYGDANLSATPVASPVASPASIAGIQRAELWILEFTDPTAATAAAFSLHDVLVSPLNIVASSNGSTVFNQPGQDSVVFASTGTVRGGSRDDAAVVVVAQGTTLYAARIVTDGDAPTPIAEEVVLHMITTPASTSDETGEGIRATGGTWDRFPDAQEGLPPMVSAERIVPGMPNSAPVSTPKP